MQGNLFKTILEQLETTGEPLSGYKEAYSLSQFEAMSAWVLGPANSKDAGKNNLWTAAMSAYADNDHIKKSKPVLSPAKRPLNLTQLKEKLGHDLSMGELCRLRRKFAFENHPDRLPATERHSATSRLAIANDLIDLAIENINQKSTPG